MFKKKLNLSALANKPIEQENQTSNEENTSILNEETPSLVNYNYDEVVVTENKNEDVVLETTTLNDETKIKDKNIEIPAIEIPALENEEKAEEIVVQDDKEEKKVEYNYEDVIVSENKNEDVALETTTLNDETKIEDKNIEIPALENEEKAEEIVVQDDKEEKKKSKKKSKKNIFKYEEVVVELPPPETEEEKEKRYEEMISKVEVKKSEFDYDKEEKIELFWNYQSDLEVIVEEKEWNKKEKINNEIENIENNEQTKEISENNENKDEEKEIIIRKPINKKVIIIISILVLLWAVIWSIFYFLNDIKNLIKTEKIDEIIVDGEINYSGATNSWELTDSWTINQEEIMEEVLTNSWISEIVDEEIKQEVETYIEEIKESEEVLTPEQIKKKINDKIIEIYLKKTMLK